MPSLNAAQATGAAARILEALGTPADLAHDVAGWLVAADLAGHPSHGIIRVHDYATRIRNGTLDPAGRAHVVDRAENRSRPVVLVDAANGYGHPAAHLLTDELCARAKESGVAAGGVINVSHTGRLGEWSEQAAAQGVILFLCYASLDKTNVAAFGARSARLGTNPLTFGVPATGDDRTILDFATSGLAGGKMQHYIESGDPVPAGNLLDADGNPSTDPNDFLQGGMLQTFGGHKGYGISLVVSLLAGCVVGQAASDLDHGVFALAIDPGLFAPEAAVLAAIDGQLDRMRQTPAADGGSVEVPGDFERRQRREHSDGLLLPESGWHNLVQLATTLGISSEELLAPRPDGSL